MSDQRTYGLIMMIMFRSHSEHSCEPHPTTSLPEVFEQITMPGDSIDSYGATIGKQVAFIEEVIYELIVVFAKALDYNLL